MALACGHMSNLAHSQRVVNFTIGLLRRDGDGAGNAIANFILAPSGDAGLAAPAVVFDKLAAAIFGIEPLVQERDHQGELDPIIHRCQLADDLARVRRERDEVALAPASLFLGIAQRHGEILFRLRNRSMAGYLTVNGVPDHHGRGLSTFSRASISRLAGSLGAASFSAAAGTMQLSSPPCGNARVRR